MDPLTDRIDAITDLLHTIRPEDYPTSLDRLQVLRMIRETAESALPYAVADARAAGESWESIGRYLGTSRQAAWERYG